MFLSSNNVRGMLLEEAVLHLLRRSGYAVIEESMGDVSLKDGPSGLEVAGRGGWHQLDAIADYLIAQPFCHPQRLVVEAKCYPKDRVGVDIIRGVVGLVKDINEYWVPTPANILSKKRYHYQSAVVSATDFTEPAQLFAFAQDVYLIPVARSAYMRPILEVLRKIGVEDDPDGAPGAQRQVGIEVERGHQLLDLRRNVRAILKEKAEDLIGIADQRQYSLLWGFIGACKALNFGLMGVFSRRFPVFLAPAGDISIAFLTTVDDVRIRWDHEGWYVSRPNGRRLFSFDLPSELFEMYAREGELSRSAAMDMKVDHLNELQAIVMQDERAHLLTFRLDYEWINELRRRR